MIQNITIMAENLFLHLVSGAETVRIDTVQQRQRSYISSENCHKDCEHASLKLSKNIILKKPFKDLNN